MGYALLITLHRLVTCLCYSQNTLSFPSVNPSSVPFLFFRVTRRTTNGKEFMRKQELIDAADANGLSHAPVGYESIVMFPVSNILVLYPTSAVCLILPFRVSFD